MFNLDKLAINNKILFLFWVLALQIFFSGIATSQELPIKVKSISSSISYLEVDGSWSWSDVELSAINFCKKKTNGLYYTNVEKISQHQGLANLILRSYDVKCIAAPSKNKPTPLETRLLQSRKFKKPFSDVKSAVQNMCKDIGTFCTLSSPQIKPVGVTNEVVKGKMGQSEVTYYATGFEQTTIGNPVVVFTLPFSYGQFLTIEFESSVDLPKPDHKNKIKFNYSSILQSADTIVRLRIKVSDGGLGEGFLYEPEVYSRWFKRIADQLFIDAIELSPAEIH